MQDPTREEINDLFAAIPYQGEMTDFDREEAIYWYANDHHGGQSSNLYSILSTSAYRPGAIATGPEPGSIAAMLYDEMADAFGGEILARR